MAEEYRVYSDGNATTRAASGPFQTGWIGVRMPRDPCHRLLESGAARGVSPVFSISVRDHVMCSHSLRGAMFGPAQNRHGATYAVTAEFRGPELDEHGVLLDLAWAKDSLGEALAPLRYADLDETFPGENTTTEFLCRYVHGELARRLPAGFAGVIRVELVENPLMAAAYEAAVPSRS